MNTCHVAYLAPGEVLPDTPYVIESAMKLPMPPPAHQIEARRGCSLLVQYCPTITVNIGERHVSNAPKKKRQVAKVANEFVAAIQVVTMPQRSTITPKYFPIGSFCMSTELGYCATR
jgi:hypothetical protein